MKYKSQSSFFPILAVAMIGLAGLALSQGEGKYALAALPFLCLPARKEDIAGEHGGGGGADTLDPFQRKVLDGVGAVKKQVETIEVNFRTLDKESKQLSDDLGKHVKNFEGLPNQVADLMRTVQSIDLKVKRERTSHFGSAMQRITADPECRAIANGIIRQAASQGGQRAIPMKAEEKKAAEDYTRALTLGSTPGSGYVNAQLIPEIYALIAEYGIWNRFDVVPVSTNSAKLIVDTTDPTMGWIAEGTAPAESSYAGGNVTATIKKMLGWIAVNNELLADSEVDISRYLLPKFANATALRLDWSATSADGTNDATDGQYTGMFFGGTAAVAASGNVSVATLDLEDFLKAMLVVDAAVLSRPAVWVIHPQQLVRCLSVKDLNGRPIFLPSTDAPALGAIGSILGYPVILSHAAPSLDGTSRKIAVFGDPMGMGICLRSDFEFAASDQVKFTEDQTVFRARARGAAVVKNALSFGMLTTAAS